MSEITIGRYTPYDTIIHKLDARNKIFLVILLMVTIFFKFTFWSTSLIFSAILFLIILIFLLLAKIKFIDLFRNLVTMWFMIIFLFIIYVFIPNPSYSHVAFRINGYPIYYEAFYQFGYIILRLLMVLMLTMTLTATTNSLELTNVIEWYLTPLKVFHFPTTVVAMTLAIALRFIPTLLDEATRIMKAQASRGIDIKRGTIFKRFKGVISLIVPLFVSSIERSEELANALEVRGYDPYGVRSKYRLYHFHLKDLVSFIIILLIFGGVLTLFIIDKRVKNIDIIYIISGTIHSF